jgi:hypothetical protein
VRFYNRLPAADIILVPLLAYISGNVAMTDAKLFMLSSFLRTRAGAKDAPSPAEGLKLVKAFLQIDDSKRRAEIIKMVEEASALKNS